MKSERAAEPLPRWVPANVRRYLLHTEDGLAIRDLARTAECCASTVLRQVRKVESRRDDPLVDAALTVLAKTCFADAANLRHVAPATTKGYLPMSAKAVKSTDVPSTPELNREAIRVLRRLCETGAVLAVAENMEKAVVVRDQERGASTRTAVVDGTVAQAMALQDWITCPNPGRISRYYITATGRAALGRLLAEQENKVRSEQETGFAEGQAQFGARDWGEKSVDDPETGRPRRVRYNMTESPLVALARRRDRDGKPFLTDEMVRAGERLREDFELAQMGANVTLNWDRFLTGGARPAFLTDSSAMSGPAAARDRVGRALSDLGPGLSDVALKCCCFLEGLETAEKRLGWSARSGKIVLRIALLRLIRHYESQGAPNQMIG